MSEDRSKNEKKKLDDKRYLVIVIIVAVVILSSIALVRFGDYFTVDPKLPPGVGEIGSEHVHAKFAVLLDGKFIDFSAVTYSKYANANDYIFMMDDGSYNIIHRHAANATLGMFFDSLGMSYTGNCFITPDDTRNVQFELFTQTKFCDEGDMKLKLYVNQKLNEENENDVIQDRDNILIVFDDNNKPERKYK